MFKGREYVYFSSPFNSTIQSSVSKKRYAYSERLYAEAGIAPHPKCPNFYVESDLERFASHRVETYTQYCAELTHKIEDNCANLAEYEAGIKALAEKFYSHEEVIDILSRYGISARASSTDGTERTLTEEDIVLSFAKKIRSAYQEKSPFNWEWITDPLCFFSKVEASASLKARFLAEMT